MIFNLGSINADIFYDLPRLPEPGETLAAKQMDSGLGGKGANQSVAAACASADVCHIGAVGPDGDWAIKRLQDFGVDVSHIRVSDVATAHAIVMVDCAGENQIVIFPGANMDQSLDDISTALSRGTSEDWLMIQNETSHQVDAARIGRNAGMKVVYSAAPFDVTAIKSMIPYSSLLIMNTIEAEQFEQATGAGVKSLGVDEVLVTKGQDGAEWHDLRSGRSITLPAFNVASIDMTGAGDTFAGYFVAGLSKDLPVQQALVQASAAAALSTTKKGTADAIPDLATVLAFLDDQDANGALDPQS